MKDTIALQLTTIAMNKFINAALQILSEAKTPLHYKEITKRALEKGILETEGATPDH